MAIGSQDLIFAAEIVLYLAAAVWSTRLAAIDARHRGRSPVLVCILVIVLFPLGAIAWLVFRPAPVETNNKSVDFNLDDRRIP